MTALAGARAVTASGAAVRRNWVTATLVLASMIYSIDWTIAAVALPHMQGTFSATQDQVSWVLTSYIVASAVMLPATGWLAARLGRRRLFLAAIGGFTVFSLFCGMVNSLPAEVLLRIGQGACGAFLIPLSQAIMLDAYPHGRARQGDGVLGHGRGARSGDRADARRLSDRRLVLALGVLHQHPDRLRSPCSAGSPSCPRRRLRSTRGRSTASASSRSRSASARCR